MHKVLAMNQISMQLDFGASIREIKRAGYSGIGIWYDKLQDYGYDRGKKELAESGLTTCVACYVGFFNQETEEDYSASRKEDMIKIEQAADLGAKTVLAVTGPRNGLQQDEAEKLLVRSLAEIGPAAERLGVKIALEPIHHMYRSEWTYISELKQGLRIVEEVDSPAVGLMFDTYHVWQEPGLLDTIKAAAGKIVACQISDWRPVTRSYNDRTIMGEGCIPLRTLLDALEKAGFAEWYDVEIFSDELWQMQPQPFLERCKSGYKSIWS